MQASNGFTSDMQWRHDGKKGEKKKETKPTSSFALMSLAESRKGIEDGREERGSMQTLG
jgi:hypothetical protein